MEHVNVTNISERKSMAEPFASFDACAVIVANEDGHIPATINKREYVMAWSSGAGGLGRAVETVSVLVPRTALVGEY